MKSKIVPGHPTIKAYGKLNL